MTEAPTCNLCGHRDQEELQLQEAVPVSAKGTDLRFDIRTVLCRNCGLVFTDPQPPAELLDAFYASQQRELFVTAEDRERIPSRANREDQAGWIEECTDGLSGARVLEIGSYDGYLLELLRHRGATCVGVEASRAASAHARERWDLDVRTGSFEDLEFEPQSFDLVILSHVLEHLRDPRGVLERCHALLRPGGGLFLDVPNALRPRVRHVVNFFCFDHLYNFSPRTLERLGRTCGFRLGRVDTDFPTSAFRYFGRAVDLAHGSLTVPAGDPRAVDECRRAIRSYAVDRELFIDELRRRIETGLDACPVPDPRIAIYGAGHHTEFLLRVTDLEERKIVGILDGNPGKQSQRFHERRVVAPERLSELRADAVVISSYDFQDEMVETLRRQPGRMPHVVTLYDRIHALSSYARPTPGAPPAPLG